MPTTTELDPDEILIPERYAEVKQIARRIRRPDALDHPTKKQLGAIHQAGIAKAAAPVVGYGG